MRRLRKKTQRTMSHCFLSLRKTWEIWKMLKMEKWSEEYNWFHWGSFRDVSIIQAYPIPKKGKRSSLVCTADVPSENWTQKELQVCQNVWVPLTTLQKKWWNLWNHWEKNSGIDPFEAQIWNIWKQTLANSFEETRKLIWAVFSAGSLKLFPPKC